MGIFIGTAVATGLIGRFWYKKSKLKKMEQEQCTSEEKGASREEDVDAKPPTTKEH